MKITLENLAKIIMDATNENIQKKVRSRKVKSRPHDQIIKDLKTGIHRNGSRHLTVGRLFNMFGYKKRGSSNINVINVLLDEENLYCYPPLSLTLPWSSKVEIHSFPIHCKGDLFSRENELQDFILKHNILGKLGVNDIIKEFSPIRTRDRLDFLGKDGDKNVVVEVKKTDGGKSAVEQVLRYAGMLKHHFPGQPVRKILVTGIQDQNTAKAIHGMTEEERNDFEWHLYNYDAKNESLSLEKVNYSDLFAHLNSINSDMRDMISPRT